MTNARLRASRLAPEFALLGFLDQSLAHGYELHQKLIDELGEIWHCSLSQTYNILTRLETQGYIEAKPLAQEKRPDKRELRLTAAGRERFEAWLGQFSASSVHAIRVEFLTRLYFLHARNPRSAIRRVEDQIGVLKKYLEELKADLQKIPESRIFNRLGMLLRISQLETLVSWLMTCKDQLPIHT